MNTAGKNFLTWLLVSAIVVFVLSLGFAHAPQSFKRLVLFYAVFGLACGVCLKWIARDRQLSIDVKLALIAGVMVASGGIHIGWQSYLKLKEVRTAELQADPQQLAMINMIKNIAGETESEEYEQRRRALQPEFPDYLAFRVSQLGTWSAPLPLLFWMCEVMLSALIAGGLIFQARTVQSSNSEQPSSLDVELNS